MDNPDLPAGAVPPAAASLPGGLGTVRPVLLYPDPALRAVAASAGEMAADALTALVADLFATLYAAGGRGLAAPQIGVGRRVFVMDEGWKAGAPAPVAVIDPLILWRSSETGRADELCLSIPGRPVSVRRSLSVRLACFDLDGAPCELSLEGAAARIAQHEVDHLNGVLIFDAAAPPRLR